MNRLLRAVGAGLFAVAGQVKRVAKLAGNSPE